MLTTFVICICFATSLNAGIPTVDALLENDNISSTSSQLLNIDDELAKIYESCITSQEHEKLVGYQYKWRLARQINYQLLEEADSMIGLAELRLALGFPPPGNWTKHRPWANAEELEAAQTVEEYFNLKEPHSEQRSLDSEHFYEHNFPPVIAFIDKRFPTVRQIFRQRFQEVLHSDGGLTIDRKTIDRMVEEYYDIRGKVNKSVTEASARTPLQSCRELSQNST